MDNFIGEIADRRLRRHATARAVAGQPKDLPPSSVGGMFGGAKISTTHSREIL